MKTLKKTIYVALLAFITIMAGCSKSDDNKEGEGDHSGTLGKYDITIDGQRYSGEVGNINGENNPGVFGLATFQQEGGITNVAFALQNSDLFASGGFEYPNGQGNNVSLDENGESSMGISLTGLPNSGYTSKAGTAKLTVGDRVNAPDGSGSIIALEVEFQGTFLYGDANGEEQSSQVSGTFKINLIRGL